MAKRPTQPEASTEQLDTLLRGYYAQHKEEHAPAASLLDAIMDQAPEAESSSALSSFWRWFWMPGLVAVAAALFLLVQDGSFFKQAVLTQPGKQHGSKQGLVFVGKGGHPVLQLLHSRKTPQGHVHKRVTRRGKTLFAGDLVQLSYQLPQTMHLMVLSLNAKGEVSLFVPFGKKGSQSVSKGAGHLPRTGSLELDDYVGPELFFLIAAKQPFAYKKAKDTILQAYQKAQKKLEQIRGLPGRWYVRTLLIQKRTLTGPQP